jgi:hypothetical protein
MTKTYKVYSRASTGGAYITGRVRACKAGKYRWTKDSHAAIAMTYDVARKVAVRYNGTLVEA